MLTNGSVVIDVLIDILYFLKSFYLDLNLMLFTYFAKHLQPATAYLLEETPTIFYAAFLTVLVVLFSCVYSVRTSAYNNMHNADDNFLTYLKLLDNCISLSHKKAYRLIAKIWLDASYEWRHLASKNCIIARNWLSSILCLVVAFLISAIHIFLSLIHI